MRILAQARYFVGFLNLKGYSPCMRFGADIPIPAGQRRIWLWAGMGAGAFNLVEGIHDFMNKRPVFGAGDILCGVCLFSFALAPYLILRYVYSEMNPGGLRIRKFWKRTEIAWQNVRSVSRSGFPESLSVFFGHTMEDYGFVRVSPANQEQFLSTLRQYAPHAEIDL